MPTRTRITTIDLFAGAGGLSLGLRAAGFQTVAAVEFMTDACKTFHGHHPDAELHDADIAEIDFREYRGEVAVVAGGPPCQPFSVGGKSLSHEDPRNCIPQFIRAVKEVHPRAFIMENVPGLVAGSKRMYFESVLAELASIGFELNWKVLHATAYGVPQKRQRLVIVGTRGGTYEFPQPTHGPSASRRIRTAGDVLKLDRVIGAPNPSIVTYAKNPDTRPNPYDGHLFNGGGRPIDLARPAPTMLASMGGNKTPWVDTAEIVPAYHEHLISGGEPRSGLVPGARRITVQEAALLQTFGPEIRLEGARSSQYKQVGNAVPPRLAEAVGRALAEKI